MNAGKIITEKIGDAEITTTFPILSPDQFIRLELVKICVQKGGLHSPENLHFLAKQVLGESAKNAE